MCWTIVQHICRIAIRCADYMLWRCAFCLNLLYESSIEDELNKGIRRMQQVISSANETTAQKFLQSADLIAEDDDFARAVAEKNTDAAVKLGSVL